MSALQGFALHRFQAAVAADPVREWMGRQLGIVPGAEEALQQYDALFRSHWLLQDLAHQMAATGERASILLEIAGEAVADPATTARRPTS